MLRVKTKMLPLEAHATVTIRQPVRKASVRLGVFTVIEEASPQAIQQAVEDYLESGGSGLATTEYVDDLVQTHIMDPEPHPNYEGPEMVDVLLLFENGLI